MLVVIRADEGRDRRYAQPRRRGDDGSQVGERRRGVCLIVAEQVGVVAERRQPDTGARDLRPDVVGAIRGQVRDVDVRDAGVLAFSSPDGPAHRLDDGKAFAGGEGEHLVEWQVVQDGGDETQLHGGRQPITPRSASRAATGRRRRHVSSARAADGHIDCVHDGCIGVEREVERRRVHGESARPAERVKACVRCPRHEQSRERSLANVPPGSSVSPNHTTPGRASPPHEGHRGGQATAGRRGWSSPARRMRASTGAPGQQPCESLRRRVRGGRRVLCDERDTRPRAPGGQHVVCAVRRAGGNERRRQSTIPGQGRIARTAACRGTNRIQNTTMSDNHCPGQEQHRQVEPVPELSDVSRAVDVGCCHAYFGRATFCHCRFVWLARIASHRRTSASPSSTVANSGVPLPAAIRE